MDITAIRLTTIATIAGLGIAGLGIAGCGSSKPAKATGTPQVGVILPDTQNLPRWANEDYPAFTQAFATAGIKADIENAGGNTARFLSITQGMIQEGVKVIIVSAIDNSSGAQAEKLVTQAGIKTIDYDHLVLGGSDSFSVSFNNIQVGQLQAQNLVSCLNGVTDPRIIEIDGAPNDISATNNATPFAQGANSVLNPLYAMGKATKLGEQTVPTGSANDAGPLFENLLASASDKVDGVLVANDSIAQQVLTIEKQVGIKAPVTGEGASVQGLQAVLDGDQCVSIFENPRTEANAASTLAIDLIKGISTSNELTGHTKDTQTGKEVPSVLVASEAITKNKVEDVIKADGLASDVCAGSFAALCTRYGVS